MPDTREVLLYGLTATHTRLLHTLNDLSEEDVRRLVVPGLAPIIWQAGHIALSDSGFIRRAGREPTAPEGYADVFKAGTNREADYPKLADVKQVLDRNGRVLEEIASTADLATPVESPSYKTIGEMLTFCFYHRGYHVGKITTLRALLGRQPLFGPPVPPATSKPGGD